MEREGLKEANFLFAAERKMEIKFWLNIFAEMHYLFNSFEKNLKGILMTKLSFILSKNNRKLAFYNQPNNGLSQKCANERYCKNEKF